MHGDDMARKAQAAAVRTDPPINGMQFPIPKRFFILPKEAKVDQQNERPNNVTQLSNWPYPAKMDASTPKDGEKREPYRPPYNIIKELIDEGKSQGFEQNAIVVRKPAYGMKWAAGVWRNWGIVTGLNTYLPGTPDQDWQPVTVQWFTPQAHAGVVMENLDFDDLIIIHAHIDHELMDQIIDSQVEE